MEETKPREPAAPLTVTGLLRREPVGFVGATLAIGLGVATLWCGLGLILVWVGSSGLLAHAARGAGCDVRRMPFYGGFVAVVLATLLASAGVLGTFLAESELGIGATALAVAVLGAALAPLAFAPIASVCGTRGSVAPLVRATDLAGGDRLAVLAPLCALIAVSLVIPIPLVLRGFGAFLQALTPMRSTSALLDLAAGAAAFVVWVLAVPASAAALTLRYLRLEQRNDAPTRLSQALAPVLGAVAIGLVALGGGVATAAVTPTPLRATWLENPPHGAEAQKFSAASNDPRIVGHAMTLRRFYCVEQGDGGRIATFCESTVDDVWLALGRDDVPIPGPLHHRVAVRLGVVSVGASALALLIVALALLWLGRIGASLRLLARPPFTLSGVLWVSDGALAFESSDGSHRASVPSSRVLAPPGWVPTDGERAVVLSETPIEPMFLRTAGAALPIGALLVIGTRESALGTAIARARRIGFRLAALALAALVCASAAVLTAL